MRNLLAHPATVDEVLALLAEYDAALVAKDNEIACGDLEPHLLHLIRRYIESDRTRFETFLRENPL